MEIPDKALFRIGEVAKLLGVPTHVVRFWQSQFPSLQPGRTSSGRFLYSRSQVEQLERIRQLLHVERLTIEGAKKALRTGKARVLLREPAEAGSGSAATTIATGGEPIALAPPAAQASVSAAANQDGHVSGPTFDPAAIDALRSALRALRREVEGLQERLEEI